jgi:hypothetical protein
MALPSLALGIGLQGQYDYKHQAALDLSRAKGRAKAEADEAAARAKKLAPYEKALLNLDSQGLLPVHAKAMREKVAEAIDYMTNNQDDLGGVTQRVYDIQSTAKAYRDQANMYKQLSLNQSALPGTQKALRAAGTLDNPQSITETFASIPGSGVSYDAQSNSYTFENPKYESVGLTIDNAINKGGAAYFEGTGEEGVYSIGEKKFANVALTPEISKIVKQQIVTSKPKLMSAINDYVQLLEQQKTPYDYSTEEGRKAFDAGLDKWLDQTIQSDVDARLKMQNVTPGKGATFNNYYSPGGKTGGILTQQGSEQINFGKGEFIQTHPGVPTLNDQTITLPNNNTMYNMRTGKRVKTTDVIKATYNKPSLVTVASENYNFPATTFTGADGKKYTLPAKSFEKGQPIPLGYDKFVVKNGKGKAQYVIFGQGEDRNGNTLEIVRSQGDVGIGPFVDASKYEQVQLDDIVQKGKEAQEKMQNEFNATAEKGRQEKAAAAKATPPKPSGQKAPVKDKGTEPTSTNNPMPNYNRDKAAAIEKGKQAAGGEMKIFKSK